MQIKCWPFLNSKDSNHIFTVQDFTYKWTPVTLKLLPNEFLHLESVANHSRWLTGSDAFYQQRLVIDVAASRSHRDFSKHVWYFLRRPMTLLVSPEEDMPVTRILLCNKFHLPPVPSVGSLPSMYVSVQEHATIGVLSLRSFSVPSRVFT